jgi:hypothetical protein
MVQEKQPKQPDMTNHFTCNDPGGNPEQFFYGVEKHLALFIKIYLVAFFLFLLIVLNMLKDYFLPGHFFSFPFFSAQL